MNDVTHILSAIEQGDPRAGEKLLPLVYEELRRLAAAKLNHEKPGQTLQATALVHEAFLRLVGDADSPQWRSRGHFLAAAAEAMRRILVDNARRKACAKHGGQLGRVSSMRVNWPRPDGASISSHWTRPSINWRLATRARPNWSNAILRRAHARAGSECLGDRRVNGRR